MVLFCENNLRVASPVFQVECSITYLSIYLSLALFLYKLFTASTTSPASQKGDTFRSVYFCLHFSLFFTSFPVDTFPNKYSGTKSSIDAKYGYTSMRMERGRLSSPFASSLRPPSRAPSISVTIRCSELLIAAVMKRGAEAERRKVEGTRERRQRDGAQMRREQKKERKSGRTSGPRRIKSPLVPFNLLVHTCHEFARTMCTTVQRRSKVRFSRATRDDDFLDALAPWIMRNPKVPRTLQDFADHDK